MGEKATDPVCGMEVDKSDPAATYEYDGKTYYFCAPGCKKRFEENPESPEVEYTDRRKGRAVPTRLRWDFSERFPK